VNCREAVEHFGEHVDGELTPFQRWRVRLHLWVCGHCRKYFRSYRTTIAAEKAAFENSTDASTGVPEALVESILFAAKIPQDGRDVNPRPSTDASE